MYKMIINYKMSDFFMGIALFNEMTSIADFDVPYC